MLELHRVRERRKGVRGQEPRVQRHREVGESGEPQGLHERSVRNEEQGLGGEGGERWAKDPEQETSASYVSADEQGPQPTERDTRACGALS